MSPSNITYTSSHPQLAHEHHIQSHLPASRRSKAAWSSTPGLEIVGKPLIDVIDDRKAVRVWNQHKRSYQPPKPSSGVVNSGPSLMRAALEIQEKMREEISHTTLHKPKLDWMPGYGGEAGVMKPNTYRVVRPEEKRRETEDMVNGGFQSGEEQYKAVVAAQLESGKRRRPVLVTTPPSTPWAASSRDTPPDFPVTMGLSLKERDWMLRQCADSLVYRRFLQQGEGMINFYDQHLPPAPTLSSQQHPSPLPSRYRCLALPKSVSSSQIWDHSSQSPSKKHGTRFDSARDSTSDLLGSAAGSPAQPPQMQIHNTEGQYTPYSRQNADAKRYHCARSARAAPGEATRCASPPPPPASVTTIASTLASLPELRVGDVRHNVDYGSLTSVHARSMTGSISSVSVEEWDRRVLRVMNPDVEVNSEVEDIDEESLVVVRETQESEV